MVVLYLFGCFYLVDWPWGFLLFLVGAAGHWALQSREHVADVCRRAAAERERQASERSARRDSGEWSAVKRQRKRLALA